MVGLFQDLFICTLLQKMILINGILSETILSERSLIIEEEIDMKTAICLKFSLPMKMSFMIMEGGFIQVIMATAGGL